MKQLDVSFPSLELASNFWDDMLPESVEKFSSWIQMCLEVLARALRMDSSAERIARPAFKDLLKAECLILAVNAEQTLVVRCLRREPPLTRVEKCPGAGWCLSLLSRQTWRTGQHSVWRQDRLADWALAKLVTNMCVCVFGTPGFFFLLLFLSVGIKVV